MMAELDSLDEMRLLALDHFRIQKMRIARAYNLMYTECFFKVLGVK